MQKGVKRVRPWANVELYALIKASERSYSSIAK